MLPRTSGRWLYLAREERVGREEREREGVEEERGEGWWREEGIVGEGVGVEGMGGRDGGWGGEGMGGGDKWRWWGGGGGGKGKTGIVKLVRTMHCSSAHF